MNSLYLIYNGWLQTMDPHYNNCMVCSQQCCCQIQAQFTAWDGVDYIGLYRLISSTSIDFRCYFYRKEFAPLGANSFPLRVPSQALEAN